MLLPPCRQGTCANAWAPSPLLAPGTPGSPDVPIAEDLPLGLGTGMDPSGLLDHLSVPPGRGLSLPRRLQTHQEGLTASEQESREREMQRGKHPGLRENTLHTPPPPCTTRLTAGTDWLLGHLQSSRRAPPPPPAAVPADRLPSVPATWHWAGHLGRAPPQGSEVPVVMAIPTFPFLHSTPWSPLSWEWGGCSPAL